MKVLVVNWAWYPSGGDWTYISNVQNLYRKNGYEIISLSTENKKNITSSNSYFISAPDYKLLNNSKNIINGIKVLKNSIVSFEALRIIDQILQEHDIKIAHLHNIHHYITPAIIWKLKKANIKIIWSLHDFKIICPENSFLSHGRICEKCITGNFYNCALNKCKKDSFAASTLASLEAYFYHKKGTYDEVDAYLCPSNFLKKKFLQFGFEPDKLHVTNLCYDISMVDNFITEKGQANSNSKISKPDYILYIGRIEAIKGLGILIDSMKHSNIELKIIGTGSDESSLRKLIISENINNIEFLGYQEKHSVFEWIYYSRFVVCPSICYENYPFSIIESFLFSKPVIGSNIAGIPELVIDSETGFLFEPGNVEMLREKIQLLWNKKELNSAMGKRARSYIQSIVNYENHWNHLSSIINHINKNVN